jgi:hypothetical protein
MREWCSSVAWVLAAVILAGPSQARTATTAEREACEARLRERLDVIDSKLRAGYGAREGELLKQRRRKLEEQRARCRFVNERAAESRRSGHLERMLHATVLPLSVHAWDRADPQKSLRSPIEACRAEASFPGHSDVATHRVAGAWTS